MRADKIAIMSMVNEGKISPEEGYRLYEELISRPDAAENPTSESNTNGSEDHLAGEAHKKMSSIYEEAEPYLRKTILSALETAMLVRDTVREKIRDELASESHK